MFMKINKRNIDFNNENIFSREHIDHPKNNPNKDLTLLCPIKETTLSEDVDSALKTFKEILKA